MFETPFKELWIHFNYEETNGNKAEELHESLNQATYENTETEDCINVDNEVGTGAAVKKIDEFVENHKQSEKDKDDKEEEGDNQQSEIEKDDKEKEEGDNQQSEKEKNDKEKEEGDNQQSRIEKDDKEKEEGDNQQSEKEKDDKEKEKGRTNKVRKRKISGKGEGEE